MLDLEIGRIYTASARGTSIFDAFCHMHVDPCDFAIGLVLEGSLTFDFIFCERH